MCALGGVDVAYPMLDDELLDFSCRIPSAMKMKSNRLRDFYKNAVTGFLPDATINKSKQGFGLPFGVWMKTHKPLREMCYDNLLKLKQRGYIRPDFIDSTIAMHQDVHAKFYGELMWVLMMLELWLGSRKL
jgi:asparagine synthase (glutamine-hydrolysing)